MIEQFGFSQEEFDNAVEDAAREWDAEHPKTKGTCVGSTREELGAIVKRAAERVGVDVDETTAVDALLDGGAFTECSKHRGHYLARGWRRGAAGAEEWHTKRHAHERRN
jgi:hypothetical protein